MRLTIIVSFAILALASSPNEKCQLKARTALCKLHFYGPSERTCNKHKKPLFDETESCFFFEGHHEGKSVINNFFIFKRFLLCDFVMADKICQFYNNINFFQTICSNTTSLGWNRLCKHRFRQSQEMLKSLVKTHSINDNKSVSQTHFLSITIYTFKKGKILTERTRLCHTTIKQ